MKFQNKIVLITGASRGIGAQTAKKFAKEGAIVIINYNSNESAAKKVLEEVGGKGRIIKADVSNQEQVNEMFDEIKRDFGEIDFLINNAGIVSSKPFLELTLDEWNKTYALNITAMFLCSQRALPLIKNKGAIINIASIRGLSDQGRQVIIDYSSSKAAVINFTKTLAKEAAPKIRVNCVSPGMTNTDIAKGYSKEMLDKFIDSIYLKRLIEPEEIADAILFLCSNEASAITGVNLVVDGGQSLL